VVDRIDVEFSGPMFERALLLAREAVTTVVFAGGPGWEAALEPVLTEMANDRAVGALVSLVLTTLAAGAATAAADAELALHGETEPSLNSLAERAVLLIGELLEGVSASASASA
jgi:hypothetical protein